MRNTKHLLIAGALVSLLALAGCTSSKPAADKATEGAPAAATAAKADTIKPGAQKMRSTIADLQKAVTAGDATKAKALTEALESAWEAFEDDVKAKDKALYGKIEDPLHAIQAGVKASSLDQKLLGDQIKELDGLLAELTK